MENNGAWAHEMLSLPDGTRLRLSRWCPSGPPLPDDAATILVLPGRAAQVERYAELAVDLSGRGLHVLSMDWRGQGGSSRLLPDPMVGHAVDFAAFLDDLDAALAHWQDQIKGPLIGLGHSMGGHILMRHVAERPHPFAGIIACAPMLGINAPMPDGMAWQLTRWAVRNGRAEQYALFQGPRWAPNPLPFKGNRLTSDPQRFALMQAVMARDPTVALGGASWGWLHGALSSIRHYFDQDRLEDVTVPTLILSARADRIVRPQAHDRAARRLPNCTLVPFPVGEHELLIEADPIRSAVLSAIDNFLAGLPGIDKHRGNS
ncbi:alpha/beta fold hydrolase [Niveispirillum cyanobacteriorum]|uniref:alpha/beta fold hydrolase n=1 Tax=Niveispirillum cyanobacteriorum TaxID=1612173 RepID=UPI001319DA54|nr:alpha/beta fold hydrolase [Niveispirillum cyanobacteriorum]